MDKTRIDFSTLAWKSNLAGMRFKEAARAGRRIRLVEISPEFTEPEGCTARHSGLILSGNVEIRYADRTVRFAAGDGVMIDGGEEDRHSAMVEKGTARLLLVDDL
jgi:hypothetical protein